MRGLVQGAVVINAAAAQTAVVYDLWAHQVVGTFTDSYTASVPSHGVVAFKLTLQMGY
jgi:hypothetical protein